jgi:hypothetical protein
VSPVEDGHHLDGPDLCPVADVTGGVVDEAQPAETSSPGVPCGRAGPAALGTSISWFCLDSMYG